MISHYLAVLPFQKNTPTDIKLFSHNDSTLKRLTLTAFTPSSLLQQKACDFHDSLSPSIIAFSFIAPVAAYEVLFISKGFKYGALYYFSLLAPIKLAVTIATVSLSSSFTSFAKRERLTLRESFDHAWANACKEVHFVRTACLSKMSAHPMKNERTSQQALHTSQLNESGRCSKWT